MSYFLIILCKKIRQCISWQLFFISANTWFYFSYWISSPTSYRSSLVITCTFLPSSLFVFHYQYLKTSFSSPLIIYYLLIILLGAGKSTFIENLGMKLIKKKNRVAVIPVDPSSHISGGSILGENRMECRKWLFYFIFLFLR